MPVLAIVPTEGELDELVDALATGGLSIETGQAGRVGRQLVPAMGLVLAHGGLGKTQFGIQTQYMLDQGQYSLVICAGAAGGLVDEVAVGDVVVATETVEHDIRKVGSEMVPRFPGDAAALARIRCTSFPERFRVHLGGVASGDEDIVSTERRRACHRTTGAIAVAWEGAGGARACAFMGVPYLEIRGIADQADERGPRDFMANFGRAMQNVASVLTVVSPPAF